MKHYVVYDGNGRIIQFGTCMDEDLHLQARAGLFVIEGEGNSKDHYIENGALRERPDSVVDLSGELLSGVRIGAEIRINDKRYIADSDCIKLSFLYPYTYKVSVIDFPFKERNFEVIKE